MKTFKTDEVFKSSSLTWEVKDEDLNKSETLSFIHSQHSLQRATERNINPQNIAIAIEYGTAFFKQGLIFYVLGENNLPNALSQKIRKKNTKFTTRIVIQNQYINPPRYLFQN